MLCPPSAAAISPGVFILLVCFYLRVGNVILDFPGEFLHMLVIGNVSPRGLVDICWQVAPDTDDAPECLNEEKPRPGNGGIDQHSQLLDVDALAHFADGDNPLRADVLL